MRRKVASKDQKAAVEKSVEVTTTSDTVLDEDHENATKKEATVQNSTVAVVSKRGRKKGVAESAKSSNLNGTEKNSDNKAVAISTTTSDGELDEGLVNATGNGDVEQNSAVVVSKRGRKKGVAENVKSRKLDPAEENKAVTVPKRGRKPANKKLEDVKDSNSVKEETTDDLKSEKSNEEEDFKVSDSSKSQALIDVPKTKVPKAPAKRGRKKADNEVSTEKSAVEGSISTEQVSDENDFQVPSHSTTKNAGKNIKKKPGPAKGKKVKDNDSKDINLEENIESNETENIPAVDDIYAAKDNAKSNPLSKRGRKRKNDSDDTETAHTTKQGKNSLPKSDVLEDNSAVIMEEDAIEKPKRGRKAVKNISTKSSNENAEGETKTVPNPKGRSSKRKVEKNGKVEEEAAEKVSKKEKIPDVTSLDFSSKSTTSRGEPWNFKISSWNINGIRAWLEKDGISYLHHENSDILCVQETKCSYEKLPEEVKKVDGYHAYWLAGDKDGYSGVGLLSKAKPLSVEYGIGVSEHDIEGRVITAEYEKFYLIAAYVPNAGRGLVRLDYRMQWDKDFCDYLKKLDEKKPIILCGDLNVSHEEIDLANPKSNKKTAGFTKEERDGFSALLEQGFVDTFRHLYPDTKGSYTFWTYMMNARAKNVGWRLDYFVTSKRFNENVCDNVIRKDVYGSDHCPITLFLAV